MRHIESGRSMVEILGVLAVIGVLSVGGIYGYRLAMDKHKANDVQEAMRLRANDASHQMLNGTAPAPFDDDIGGILMDIGSVKDVDATPGADDPQFAIHLQNIPEGVARQLINSNGGIGAGVVGIKDSHLSHLVTSLNDLTPNGDGMYDLAYIFDSTMEANCPAGQYVKENKCVDCPEGKVCTGGADYAECPSAQEPNAKRSACVPCAEGEVCGCPKGKADGNGKCVECIKNSDCSGKVCSDALCHPCPNKGDCSGEKGFTCSAGYHPQNHLCCPDHANCSDETGELVISCEAGYYLSEGICLECPHGATCVGGMTTFECKSEYKKQGTICCPSGATCQIIGNDYRVSCPKNTYVHDKDCLPCPSGLTCKGGEEMPTCPAGNVFNGKECSRAHCEQTNYASPYVCYVSVNGTKKNCGYNCQDTTLSENSCTGYCQDFCPKIGTTWGVLLNAKELSLGGMGCVDKKTGLHCTHRRSGDWACAHDKNSNRLCCYGASDFGECKYGTCDDKICQELGGTWEEIKELVFGCKIVDNNKTIYCAPWGEKWRCQQGKAASSLPECASCSFDELKKGVSGACGTCWGKPACKAWGTWDDSVQRCVGTGSDGQEYSCDLQANCYYGKTDNRCGVSCGSMSPTSCGAGICGNNCPAGSYYAHAPKSWSGTYGCRWDLPEGGYLFYTERSNKGVDMCYYGANQSSDVLKDCGKNCSEGKGGPNADCLRCKDVFDSHCENGQCQQNGQEVKGCECKGEVSNGHCCPVGHAYVNGACSIYNSTGTCLYQGFYQFDETDEYKANGSGQCQCVDEDKCLKFDEGTISCEFTSAKLKRSASGLCEEVK